MASSSGVAWEDDLGITGGFPANVQGVCNVLDLTMDGFTSRKEEETFVDCR